MKNDIGIVRTPNGACLGKRVMIDGKIKLQYKAGKKIETLCVEDIIECIMGIPVDHIVYKQVDT